MILLVSASFPPEPIVAATMTLDLTEALADNHKVVILSPRPSRPLGFTFKEMTYGDKRFEHVVLKSFVYPKSKVAGRALESYSFGKHAVKYIRKNHNLIKCCYVNVWPLIAQYMIIRILKKYSIPAVTHIQDIYPESFTNRITYYKNILKTILLPIDLFVLKNSAKIIANSNLMYSTFVENRGITPGKIEIVQNWRNETEFLSEENSTAYQPVRNYKTRPFTFMFLGNIGPVAGVDFIIKCFAEACFKDVSLIIAGCGSEKESCKKLAESFNNSNIEFWNVPPGSVPVVQELADVMLLPLKKCTGITSIPSKLLAYMFSKKPILACVDEYSDTAYAINKGRCGWVLPPENAEILVNTIKSIISIPHDDLKILGNNGYNYALENYSRKMNLKRLVSVIENALRP